MSPGFAEGEGLKRRVLVKPGTSQRFEHVLYVKVESGHRARTPRAAIMLKLGSKVKPDDDGNRGVQQGDDALATYLKDISDSTPLSSVDEAALARRIRG